MLPRPNRLTESIMNEFDKPGRNIPGITNIQSTEGQNGDAVEIKKDSVKVFEKKEKLLYTI